MASWLLLLLLAAGDLEAAEEALREGRPEEAIRLLGDLADVDEPDVRALVVLGRAYLAMREYPGAVEPLLRASDRRPEDHALARDAAYACWGSAAGIYAEAYLEDAKRMARRAEDPLLLADLHYQSGDYEQALEAYDEVPDADASRLHVRTRVAECHAALEQREPARVAYAAALEEALRLEDLRAAYRLAFAGNLGGRYLSWLDARVAEQPDDIRYRLYRGYARCASLMYGAALEDLRIVVEARPDDLDARDRLVLALLQEGTRLGQPERIAEAEALAREILQEDPAHEGARTNLNWLAGHYWANGDVPRSYAVLGILHATAPEDIDTALNFAAMARRLGRDDEARATYDALLEIAPDEPAVLVDLGILVDGQGERDEAVRLWRRVLEIEPENLDALENVFTAAWESGDGAAIAEYLDRGLAASDRPDGPHGRWIWFRDRLRWAPTAWGG